MTNLDDALLDYDTKTVELSSSIVEELWGIAEVLQKDYWIDFILLRLSEPRSAMEDEEAETEESLAAAKKAEAAQSINPAAIAAAASTPPPASPVAAAAPQAFGVLSLMSPGDTPQSAPRSEAATLERDSSLGTGTPTGSTSGSPVPAVRRLSASAARFERDAKKARPGETSDTDGDNSMVGGFSFGPRPKWL
jgi:hypothetical protein